MLKLTEFIGKGAAPLAVSAENGKTGAESVGYHSFLDF